MEEHKSRKRAEISAIWDPAWPEMELFKAFKALSYFAAVVRNPNMRTLTDYVNVGIGEPFGLPKLPGVYSFAVTRIPGLHIAYWGAGDVVPPKVARADIAQELDNLNATGVIVGETEIEELFNHTPWRLYATPEEIRKGFYAKLYALQGKESTYWSGATFMSHDSARIWRFTEDLLPQLLA